MRARWADLSRSQTYGIGKRLHEEIESVFAVKLCQETLRPLIGQLKRQPVIDTQRTYVRRAIEGERVDAQALFREQARQRKKPNIDVRSLVIKTKTNSGKAMQQEQKVGQPA